MPHHQPSSTSKYAKIFSFSASNEFHTRPWTKWHFWKGRKNRRMTLTQFTNAWQLSELYWSNKSRHCCLVSPSLNINYLDTEESSFLPWCEVILHTHTHTHITKKKHTPDIHSQPRQALIYRQTQTHIDSLPCYPPLAHSQTAHHLTAHKVRHTHTHTRSRSLSGASI